jgi:hypothetical protein
MHFSLADLIADIAQNAAESGARTVRVEIEETDRRFRFSVADDGKGMSPAEAERAKDPFHSDGIKHPNRRVGLGIPFLMQAAGQSGGGWDLVSEKGVGTTVSAWFDLANVDTPPRGSVPGLMRTVLLFSGPEDMELRRSLVDGRRECSYEVRKSELLDALGSLEDAGALVLLDRYLLSLEEEDPAVG